MSRALEYSLQGPELSEATCKARAEHVIEPEKVIQLGPC